MAHKNKKKVGILFIFLLAIAPVFYLPLIHVTVVPFISDDSSLKLSAGDGVSNYSITESITYEVDINFTISQTSGIGNYYFKFPRLNDRDLDSPLAQYSGPYQDSNLTYLNKSGAGSEPRYEIDRFNNSYDIFNVTVMTEFSTPINFQRKFNITLNEVVFGAIQNLDIDMDDYDIHDPMFDLYCNNSEQYYETNNTALKRERFLEIPYDLPTIVTVLYCHVTVPFIIT